MNAEKYTNKVIGACVEARNGCFSLVALILCLAVSVAMLILFTGCATTRVEYRDKEIIKTHHDTLSIYEKDSIFINQYMNGDTIFRDVFRDRWRYKDRIVIKTDTFTINQVQKEVVQVKASSNWWKWLVSGLAIGAALIVFLKKFPYTKPFLFWL